MKHFLITTEAEYDQFIADKKELEEYRRWKEGLPEQIRFYFSMVKDRIETYSKKESWPAGVKATVMTSCIQENGHGYCDMCPIGYLFSKCPLGYYKEYSK